MEKHEKHEQEQELHALAQQIRAWQDQNALTTSALIRRFANLGSDKTYNKILRGDYAQLDVVRQLANYRSALALLESIGVAEEEEDIYEDLSPIVHLRRTMLGVFKETGNARFVLVEGESGSGKTTAAKQILAKYGSRCMMIELSPVYRDSSWNFLALIYEALGYKDPPNQARLVFSKIVQELNTTRRCLFVDELHHCGPNVLNTIKTLINQTPGEIVGLTMPTLWGRLEKKSYEECKQLTGNRLAERIRIDTLTAPDIRKFISRRLPGLNGTTEQAIKLLQKEARGRGNLAFVRNVCKRALDKFEGEKITIEDFASVVRDEANSR